MKRRLGIILAILLLSEFLFASVKVNNIYYELDDVNRTAFVTNPDVEGEYAGNIVIPASILYNDIEYLIYPLADNKVHIFNCKGNQVTGMKELRAKVRKVASAVSARLKGEK